MIANYPVDLHSHTYLSDGADSINELVENAVDSGLKVLALTDHDILPPREIHLPGGGSHALVEWAGQKGLCLLRGVEFSCESDLEDVHIIGLECDWADAALQRETRAISQSKASAYEETVRRLNQRGYDFSMEELLSFGGRGVDLLTLQKKRIFDLMAAKGFVKSWADAKLLVRDDPFLNVKREKPSALQIIDVIHRTGGVAILAHPYLIDPMVEIGGKPISRWSYIEMLISAGLDGLEVRYTYNKSTCKDKRPCAEIWAELTRNARGRLIISGGSDYHADYKKNAVHPRRLGECGLTMDEFFGVPQFQKMYQRIMGDGKTV